MHSERKIPDQQPEGHSIRKDNMKPSFNLPRYNYNLEGEEASQVVPTATLRPTRVWAYETLVWLKDD